MRWLGTLVKTSAQGEAICTNAVQKRFICDREIVESITHMTGSHQEFKEKNHSIKVKWATPPTAN